MDPIRAFAILLPLSLIASLSAQAQDQAKAPPKEAVAAFVKQLQGPDVGVRNQASKELIKLGPPILPLLPDEDELTSEPQRRQLADVIRALKNQQIQQELPPRLVTLQGPDVPLETALGELVKQTSIKVEDRRRTKTPRLLKLDLKGVTFWQALDTLAKEAGAQVSLYQRDGVVALVDGPHKPVPVSYSGVFRVALLRKILVDDVVADAHNLILTLEIAWEPRFRPYLLETVPHTVTVQDDTKHELPAEESGGKASIEGKLATIVELHFPAPPRSATRLDTVRGEFSVTGAGEMLTFTFSSLAQLEKDAAVRQQVQKGVTVKVSKPTLADDLWTVEAQLEYPRHGPKFESFQSWIGYNEMFLRKVEGSQRFPNNGGYSVEKSSADRATIRYHFVDKRQEKLMRGNPADWQVVYKTPGILLEVPVPFTFRNVVLP